MKKFLPVFLVLSLLAACSNPVLKWIDTPERDNGRTLSGRPDEKEIISFTFGLDGETDLPVGKTPDRTGKYPISVILPAGTRVESLGPEIGYIGRNLDPPSGEREDFRSPVVYTVTAEDDSTREYVVRVYVKTAESKEIVRFALDVSGTGDTALSAEGVIDGEAGTIFVSVPAGLDTRNVNARIAHTGASVTGPLGNPHPTETFDFRGDFSAPTIWTVVAQDHTTKTYTVTVVREKSHDKEITRFSFGIAGEDVIIGGEPQPDGKYPILAIVPDTSIPSINNTTPFISYTGASISPGPDTPLDFSSPARPVPYTVTAEDRSTRDYVVTVIRKDDSFDSVAQITGFYFIDPLVEGLIDETAGTIALTVPPGTGLGALRPEIYYIGDSISPGNGQPRDFTGSDTNPVKYTVRARNGTTRQYNVSVFTGAVPPVPRIDVPGTDGEKVTAGTDAAGNPVIFVELPVYILNPVINIGYGGSAGTQIINNNNVFNNITMGDNNEYNIIVINPPSDAPSPPPSSDASIDGFYFTSPAAIGKIGKTDGTEGAGTPADPYRISVTVPYGTDLRNLAATVCYTGREIAGIPGTNPLKDSAWSFTGPVDYTVIAGDGTPNDPGDNPRKTYRVTVRAAPNNAKEISDFSFMEVTPVNAMISAAPNVAGRYPIVVTVPPGQAVTGLIPVITHTGASIAGPGSYADSSGPGTVTAGAETFSPATPADYTVTAEDGSTRTYAVTVRNARPQDDGIEITGFYFTEPLAVGAVNQDTNTITVRVPSKTGTANLRPTVYFKGMSLKHGSGAANNFSGPASYTVTGNSGKTRTYTVTVISTPSGAKDITRFSFPGIFNTETIIGAVPDTDGNYPISVRVPSGTDLDNLVPDISHTGAGITPAGAPGNFNNPRTYTVTAEDGSTKTYTVTVYPQSGSAKVITSFIFEEVPLGPRSSPPPPVGRIVASIDQNNHTIRAEVPFAADTRALAPTLTWIGRSLAGPTGGDKTANPFTDTARDFINSQTYTVRDQDGNAQPYTVTVIRKSSVIVTFEGEKDQAVAGSAFDQNTGTVTVTVNNDPATGVSPPYEWYLDGVKQSVPDTQGTFTLNAGDGTLIPGRHEITVSGKKDGLHYTGRVYFTVSGGTK
jgi:hypothetical protein